MPSSDVGDKFLWTAVIASAVVAYFYIPSVLNHVRELAAVPEPNPDKPRPQLQKDAEDAIKLSSLGELALGPSYNLSTSALKLLFSRFLKSGAKRGLLRDLSSKSWHQREQALSGIGALFKNPALRELDVHQHFVDRETFQALVTGMINLLPEHFKNMEQIRANSSQQTYPSSPIRSDFRPAHERTLLRLLNRLLQEPQKIQAGGKYVINAELAIEAGIITKWLAVYPFPCALPENSHLNYKKSDVCRLMDWKAWGSDDMPMALLFSQLVKQESGAKQLLDVGLRSGYYDEKKKDSRDIPWPRQNRPNRSSTWPGFNEIDDDNDVRMIDGEETAGHITWRPFNVHRSEAPVPRPGSTDRSPEEESLRRRHREAVVVAEAGAPLRPENILQRQPTETDLTWERVIQEQQDTILRHRAANAANANPVASQIARERIDGLELDAIRIGPAATDIDGEADAIDSDLRPEHWTELDRAADHFRNLILEYPAMPEDMRDQVMAFVNMVRARDLEEGALHQGESQSAILSRWLERSESLLANLRDSWSLPPDT